MHTCGYILLCMWIKKVRKEAEAKVFECLSIVLGKSLYRRKPLIFRHPGTRKPAKKACKRMQKSIWQWNFQAVHFHLGGYDTTCQKSH